MIHSKPFKSFLLAASVFATIVSCSKDDVVADIQETRKEIAEVAAPEYAIRAYSFDVGNSDLMFQDGETQEVMVSDARRYLIASVLRVRAIDEFTFEVANFSPVPIENAIVLATIDGIEKQVELFKIDRVAAFAKSTVRYSFLDESTEFRDVNDAVVDLSTYKESGIAIDKISFDFTGESAYLMRLKKLSKLKWEIQYHDYDPDDNQENNWEENLTPHDVRRYTGMIINFGFMIASDEFREGFLAEKIVGNDGKTLLTQVEKENIYQQMLDKEFFRLGKVVNVSGLGGGSTLGVAEHVLRDYLKNNQFSIVSHEFGHMLGFGHSSGMTYPKEVEGINSGIDPLTKRINLAFLESKAYPVSQENYFYSADFESK